MPSSTARERWLERNPHRMRELSRKSHLKKKFGMTPDDYDRLLESQDGACAICRTTDSSPWEFFSIDHCHDTGRVRGLLCMKCNTVLGQASDSPDRLRAAIAYLEERDAA